MEMSTVGLVKDQHSHGKYTFPFRYLGGEGEYHLCVPIVSGECLGVAVAIARNVAEDPNVLGLRCRSVRRNIHNVGMRLVLSIGLPLDQIRLD